MPGNLVKEKRGETGIRTNPEFRRLFDRLSLQASIGPDFHGG